MKHAEQIYWRLCQYPWYNFTSIGIAGLLYLLAIKHGSKAIAYGKIINVANLKFYSYDFTFVIDILTIYIVFSFLIVLIVIPFLLRKGIIFMVLSYTFYLWFLFVPIHLLLAIIRDDAWTLSSKLTILFIAIVLFGILSVSLFYFPNHVVRKYVTLESDKLKTRTRIVHLSDIHAEHYGSRERNVVAIVDSLEPGIIIITGDIFNTPYKYNTDGFNAAVRVLEQLRTKYGVFIVEGHHDKGDTHHIVEANPSKVKLLNDEWFHFIDDNISIFGASLNSGKVGFDNIILQDNFKIFFAHDPILTRNLKSSEFDLALFGHTHACQVYLPIISSFIIGKYKHGLSNYKNTPLYVNAGVGMEGYLSPRIRWFTFPEVVVIDLVPKTS